MPKKYTDKERIAAFWSRVKIAGLLDCWEYQGSKHCDGYGFMMRGEGRLKIKTHRFVWQITYGAIPVGALVCHKCDNPLCVNPSHLYLGTIADNMRDRKERGGYTTQPKGEAHSNSVLKDDDVRAIKKLLEQGCRHKTIAAKYGVCRVTISRIYRGESWQHI